MPQAAKNPNFIKLQYIALQRASQKLHEVGSLPHATMAKVEDYKPWPGTAMAEEKKNDINQIDDTIGAYGAQNYTFNIGEFDLSPEQYRRELAANKGRLWKDSEQGRGAIRMFSRGVLGAGAFTWGGYFAATQMRGYNPLLRSKNFVQMIAKTYDVLAGKPIKALVNALGYDGEKFLTFRPSMQLEGYGGKMGRSLGHEVIGVTFDFGAMSCGDFWGRKIADTLDPNIKIDWKDDQGNIDPGKAASRFAKNWWTAITYAAGEDWAVAVPYVLTMRHIGTPAINKMFPGYARDFDMNGNGSTLLVNEKGRIRGNLTAAGVLNFWERFTTYNVGTLMFREAYNWIGDRFAFTRDTGRLPPILNSATDGGNDNPQHPVLEGARELVQWAARDAVKASIYMIPAVPFFWVTRVPQHKYRGYFMHPEKGILKYRIGAREEPLRAHSLSIDPEFKSTTPVFFEKTGEAAENPFTHATFNAYGKYDPHAKTYGFWDTLLTPVGYVNDGIRYLFHPIGKWLDRNPDAARRFGVELDVSPTGRIKLQSGRAVVNTFVNASIAYTPYFWMKSDVLAHKWDDGRTDISIERALDGAAKLNAGEVKAGIGELGHSLRGEPLPDPEREKLAQIRIAEDLTPPDSVYDLPPASEHYGEMEQQLNTRSFAGRLKAHKDQALSRMETFKRQVQPRKNPLEEAALRAPTYAEQERIRKLGEDNAPPGPEVTVH